MAGIFNIVMFICGTVIFVLNSFNELTYEPAYPTFLYKVECVMIENS